MKILKKKKKKIIKILQIFLILITKIIDTLLLINSSIFLMKYIYDYDVMKYNF